MGSEDQIFLPNIQSPERDVLQAKLVEGTSGEVKIWIFRHFLQENFEKWLVILLNCPKGHKVTIMSLCWGNHRLVIMGKNNIHLK